MLQLIQHQRLNGVQCYSSLILVYGHLTVVLLYSFEVFCAVLLTLHAVMTDLPACVLHCVECLKGPEEQFSLFGEVFPDTLRVSFCQDEESATRRVARKSHDSPIPMEMDPLFDMDVLMSEFSDTLFSTLASHQPVVGPNQRDIGERNASGFVVQRSWKE